MVKPNSRLRLVLIAAAIFLIIVALSFGGWLNIVTFKKNYVDSISAGYQVAALGAKRNIEYAVRYGKPLDNFTGMDQLLKNIGDNTADLDSVRIVDRDGRILNDSSGPVQRQVLPPDLQAAIDFTAVRLGSEYITALADHQYHIFVPVRDKDSNWIGTIDMAMADAAVTKHVNKYSWTVIQSTVVIAIISLNFMVFILFAVPIADIEGRIRRIWLIAIVAAIFGLAQISYSAFNINLFQKAYATMAESNMSLLAKSVKRDVETVIAKGVPYARLAGVDEYLALIIAGSPEIAGIAVTNTEGKTMAESVSKQAGGYSRIEPLNHFQALIPDRNGVAGQIKIWLSLSYIEAKMQEILTAALTVAGLFLLLVYETVRFIPFVWQQSVGVGNQALDQAAMTGHCVRPLSFLFFFAVGVCLTVSMGVLVAGGLGFGWPVAAAMAGLAVAGASGRGLVRRTGWRFTFVAGAGIIWAGSVLSLIAKQVLSFAAAGGLAGVGYGLAWGAVQFYINQGRGPAGREAGSFSYWAGMLGGLMCGTITGGLLAGRASASETSLIIALLLLAASGFAALLIRGVRSPDDMTGQAALFDAASSRGWITLLCKPVSEAVLPLMVGWLMVSSYLGNFTMACLGYGIALLALIKLTKARTQMGGKAE